jgi:hypothetical protein
MFEIEQPNAKNAQRRPMNGTIKAGEGSVKKKKKF